jgi:exosortase E/protease (VPEID-CTERM system)
MTGLAPGAGKEVAATATSVRAEVHSYVSRTFPDGCPVPSGRLLADSCFRVQLKSDGTTVFLGDLVERDSDWRLVQRIGTLLALLTLELVIFRQWLNAAAFHDYGTVGTLLAQRGPGTVRFVFVRFAAACAMLSLVFVDARATAGPRRVLAASVRGRFGWHLLLAHVALTALFAALSSFLSAARLPAGLDIALTALWLATGLAAGAAAVLAFIPGAFWVAVFRSMRHVVAFACVVSAGAYVFSQMALTLWQPLSRATLTMAYTMLHPFVPDLFADPASFMLGTPAFQVAIDAACSGYEGLGLMLVVTAAWLWFYRSEWRFPQALVLIPGGLAAIWLLNSVRVAALVFIGIAGAPDIAVGGFHTQAGWLALVAVALGICLTARHVPWFLKDRTLAPVSGSDVSNPVAAYLIPFLSILAASMVAQLASGGFEWLYPLRVIAALAALWYFRQSYRTLTWRFGWTSIALGVFAFLVWIGLESFVNPGARTGIPLELARAPTGANLVWLIFRVLGAVVTVPIAEELAFRGFLMRQFDSNEFQSVRWQSVSWLAIVLSSAAFGALHGVRWVPAAITGVVYAVAVIRRGSIGDAIAAHATTNALIAGVVLVGGYWQFW